MKIRLTDIDNAANKAKYTPPKSAKIVGSKIKIITPPKARHIPIIRFHLMTSLRKITESIVANGTPNCNTIATDETY